MEPKQVIELVALAQGAEPAARDSALLVAFAAGSGVLCLLFAALWLAERARRRRMTAQILPAMPSAERRPAERQPAGAAEEPAEEPRRPAPGDGAAAPEPAPRPAAESAARPVATEGGEAPEDVEPVEATEPAEPAVPAEGGEWVEAVEQPRGCEILVVDDEAASRISITAMLEKVDYHIHEAASGREALRRLEQRPVDLVLLDIRMPGLSGYDVCRAIRKQYAADELPILFFTGDGSMEGLLAGFEAGGNDYLVKPVRVEEVLARVRIHLSTLSAVGYRRRLRQAVRASREERELRRQLFEARERERRRLAQDLHDGPIQDLHAVALALKRQPRSLEQPVGQLSQAMADLRSVCSELRPPALAYGGLGSSLEIHLSRLQDRHPAVDFRLVLMEDDDRLSEWSRLQLFRISQEAVSNALQHGAPGQVELGFELDSEGCCLWVQDDGRGFEVPERWIELARQEHFGLIGISERAEAMGGRMTLDSAPGRGAVLRVEVPWPADGESDAGRPAAGSSAEGGFEEGGSQEGGRQEGGRQSVDTHSAGR